ncbi:glycosyltransferase N-terminal domain-containing protein [Halobacteriovorax sp. GB3]|uniref:glycosyltransferase N-terminal domain-containing protein n=1 Tax=Halobacteriovorax sp. GB3 TaxID=2719615 RepID=UPI00236161BA|nr:glycosyltransferase N-terminal domain-containing protein [Halobacteriovorax sp. GB3]MDD0852729.1 glycosyltransferase N-terminal domain-containing protein [Halobacteriovorax sp. GB3]
MEFLKFTYLLITIPFMRMLALLVGPITPFNRFLKERLLFEKRNNEPGCQSFSEQGLEADLGVHVSSEGELEQVLPIVRRYLESAKKVELIFTSPSVEKKIKELYKVYPNSFRYLRLPLLKAPRFRRPFLWVTTDHFIMVRYDFFPELLLLSRFCSRFTLVWATLKGKEYSPFSPGLFPYRYFTKIIPATESDQNKMIDLSLPVDDAIDFRVVQINKRLQEKEKKLAVYEQSGIAELIKSYPRSKRLVYGSCWPVDIESFSKVMIEKIKNKEIFVALCPHKINDESVDQLKELLKLKGLESVCLYRKDESDSEKLKKVSSELKEQEQGTVFISALPGRLCEFYSLFGNAYVSGGFGRSIHSVLEPYLAGAFVFCGPKTHRSTEFDLVKENDDQAICSFSDLPSLWTLVENRDSFNEGKCNELIDLSSMRFNEMIKKL